MNFIKKKFLCLLIISLTFCNITNCGEIDDEIDIEDIDDNNKLDLPTREKTDIDILNLVLMFKINEELKNDFYLKTHTVLKRPTQTLAIFNLYHTDHVCQDWLFRLNIFGNKTDRAFFTDHCIFLDSYVDLDQSSLVRTLEEFDNDSILRRVLNIARRGKKEERRGGFMIQALKNFNDISFEFTIPLIYEERNYFFTQSEREEIEELFGQRPEKEQDKEYRKHAISDKLGFGDARIKLGQTIVKNENIYAKFGFQTTLPIAFAFKKGLIGSNFAKVTKQPRPTFDLKELIDLFFNDKQKLQELGREFALKFADWLSAMVLDSPLGNSGHFSLGAFFEPQIKINDGVTLKAITYLEYFFPANENRFFLIKKNPRDFDIERTDNEAQARRDLQFLNEQIIETLFPPVFRAQVTPGFMFQFTVGPQFRLREWDFLIGYDFWYQHREKINYVFDSSNNLKINKATKPRALSSKIFTKLAYNKIEKCRDWSIALSLEDTLASTGVGKDYSVALSFELNY